ncbi:MAG: nucleotide exchange factor GrpE [Euryarchaeota archaeon RBG_16_67_27]|nr:MAG: nucleotide exchange factor GrpE [Euryarchaeota archaeon RBG_16_67_27]
MSEETRPVDESGATPEGREAPASSDLKEELEATRRERLDLFERLQYLQADFENFRKRTARDAEALVKVAHEALVARLLPVLDDFDAALASVQGDASKGLRMVHGNLLRALSEAGLQEIPAHGATFDPYVHDCIQWVPESGVPDGTVKEVVRKGYRLQDRILRPAQVIVVRNGGDSNA